MPDGSNMRPVDQRKPAICAEDRAHRLHALVWAVTTLELDGAFDGEVGANDRGNLLRLACEESDALIATGGFC